VNKIIQIIIILILCIEVKAQHYIGKNGTITFFSKTPLENINASNNKVAAIYDIDTRKIAFKLNIKDFIFSNSLMQEHFNENYLESDIFPHSTFVGEIVSQTKDIAEVEGKLTIHGITNLINASGKFEVIDNVAIINEVKFYIKLRDYGIKVPKIVMYNIAEEIEVKVNIKMSQE
tara:strand:- start:6744 stop:7268 length:525 start_codon:yes stop_codon:yes gene_type:complete